MPYELRDLPLLDIFRHIRNTELRQIHIDQNQSVRKPLFKHFKLNTTDKESIAYTREKDPQLPAAVLVPKRSVINLPITF